MRAIRLTVDKDAFNDALGFIIKGTPRLGNLMADRDGTLIAHDILEHQNGPAHMGKTWDELEAMGGIWHVRGRHADAAIRASAVSPALGVASDIVRMFPEFLEDEDHGPGGVKAGLQPHPCDPDFGEIVEAAYRDIVSLHGGDDPTTYLDLAWRRMRIGYRKAERRFGPTDLSFRQHSAIRAAVENALPLISTIGQEFILRYGRGEAYCHPHRK